MTRGVRGSVGRKRGVRAERGSPDERLARLRDASFAPAPLSEEGERALLDARARALAKPIGDAATVSDLVEALVFELSGERYAVGLRFVKEIRRSIEVTRVPGARAPIAGIAHVRGEVIAVVDLARLFDLPQGAAGDRARLVVLGEQDADLAFVADAAEDVVTLRADAIVEAPAGVLKAGRAHVRGLAPGGLLVLDAGALLRDPRLLAGGSSPDRSETGDVA